MKNRVFPNQVSTKICFRKIPKDVAPQKPRDFLCVESIFIDFLFHFNKDQILYSFFCTLLGHSCSFDFNIMNSFRYLKFHECRFDCHDTNGALYYDSLFLKYEVVWELCSETHKKS